MSGFKQFVENTIAEGIKSVEQGYTNAQINQHKASGAYEILKQLAAAIAEYKEEVETDVD